MDDAKPAKPEPKGELFVVDGSNVCHWHKHYETGRSISSVRPLLLLLCVIREHGDDFYCVFDHTITHRLGSPKEPSLIAWLLENYPKHFTITAIDSRADPVILHYANKNGSRIITNDRYRDYFEQFAWLTERYTPRLIQGNYHQSGLLTLEKLSYGYMELKYSAWTRDYVHRLDKCLAHDFDWRTAKAAADAGGNADSSVENAKSAKDAAAVAAAPGRASDQALSGTPKPQKTKKTSKAAPMSGKRGTAKKVAPKVVATKTKVKAGSASSTGTKRAGKTKTSRAAHKKPAKSKSKPVQRRRSPPRKKRLLERLFDYLK